MAEHWYDDTGTPKHKIIGANGVERDTDLRDARKLGLKPSVNGIMNLINETGLQRWSIDQTINAAWNHRNHYMDQDKWSAMVALKADERRFKAQSRGTLIHKALETYYNTGEVDTEVESFILPVIKLVDKEFPGVKFISEKTFVHNSGFGGTVDLHSIEGNIVIDFKGKEKNSTNWKDVKQYTKQHMQLAAYREGLGISTAQCFNIFISNEESGLLSKFESKEEVLVKHWNMFQYLLAYWKLDKNYDSSTKEIIDEQSK